MVMKKLTTKKMIKIYLCFSATTMLIVILQNFFLITGSMEAVNNQTINNVILSVYLNNLVGMVALPAIVVISFRNDNKFWKFIDILSITLSVIYIYIVYVEFKNG